jgi:signal transduction histidine kinase
MTGQEHELRVLVVAPTGRDGPLICNLLRSKDIPCASFATPELARLEFRLGTGAVILAEEAFRLSDVAGWAAQVAEQPSWSDIPLILLTVAGAVDHENQRKIHALQPLGNLVLLERPVRPETFLSTVQAALRGRLRQYQLRDFLAQRRMAEEALRKSEKLLVAGRLAASVSHEINNPLASVTNLLYLIGTSSSLEEAKAHRDIAAEELARISEIVTQTLKFYREQSKPSMVQITDIVDSALFFYRGRLSSAGIVIERDLKECSPILAVGGELRQVILNLISNSLDALRRGGTLRIRAANAHEHSNGSRPGIRLTIADSGSGIQSAIRRTLFDPFVSTKGDRGTGLGLWVSSQIVGRHGGSIQVKSRAQSDITGSVFSIFLPLSPTPQAQCEAFPEKSEISGECLSPPFVSY